jgi:acetyl esterase/lipase
MRSFATTLIAAALIVAVVPSAVGQSMRERFRERAMHRQAPEQRQGMQDAMSELEEDGAGTPVPLPPGVRVDRDVAYGADAAERLDVYRPEHPAQHAPVIFVVHGGAWMIGNKGTSKVVKNKVAHWVPKGYFVVIPDYPMSPKADPVQQASEVAKALAFAQAHAGEWGADPARFVLVGHSAGAHLVSLLTAAPETATREHAKPWLGTVALDSAAFNVVEIMESKHFRFYDRVFGTDRALWRQASPTLRLERAPLPMLLVCSEKRKDSCAQARAFAAKATGLGGRVSVAPVDLKHGEINDLLGTDSDYTRRVDDFLASLGVK